MNEFEEAKKRLDDSFPFDRFVPANEKDTFTLVLWSLISDAIMLIKQNIAIDMLINGVRNPYTDLLYDSVVHSFYLNCSAINEKHITTVRNGENEQERKYNCTLKFLRHIAINDLRCGDFKYIERSVLIKKLDDAILFMEQITSPKLRNGVWAHHSLDMVGNYNDYDIEMTFLNYYFDGSKLNGILELLYDFWYSVTGIKYPHKTIDDYFKILVESDGFAIDISDEELDKIRDEMDQELFEEERKQDVCNNASPVDLSDFPCNFDIEVTQQDK